MPYEMTSVMRKSLEGMGAVPNRPHPCVGCTSYARPRSMGAFTLKAAAPLTTAIVQSAVTAKAVAQSAPLTVYAMPQTILGIPKNYVIIGGAAAAVGLLYWYKRTH